MATRWVEEQNGVSAEFILENGVVHKRLFDPMRNAILENNRQVRQHQGARMMDWGKMICDIPLCDMPVLRGLFGEALFNDQYSKEDRKTAREKFLKSAASDPYRVEERKRPGAVR